MMLQVHYSKTTKEQNGIEVSAKTAKNTWPATTAKHYRRNTDTAEQKETPYKACGEDENDSDVFSKPFTWTV